MNKNHMENKQDIRITKTQRALISSLLTLLDKRPFSKITVNDICREALVSRSTFYVHYEDKYVLLKAAGKQLFEKLCAETKSLSVRRRLLSTLKLIHENPKIFRHIFMDEQNKDIRQMFHIQFSSTVSSQATLKEFSESHSFSPVIPVFFAGGLAAAIGWWIESNYPIELEEFGNNLYEILCRSVPDDSECC